MTQTTDGITLKDCKVEISTDGSSYTDISGFANQVTLGGGARMSGEAYTFDGDTAIIGTGKREPIEVTVRCVYTEGTGDPFETVRAVYEAGSALYVRWSPKGGDSGEAQYTTDEGVVTAFGYPAGEAASGDPVVFEFTVKTAKITKSTVA